MERRQNRKMLETNEKQGHLMNDKGDGTLDQTGVYDW